MKNKVVPYIIAEAGVNHNGEMSAALRLVDIARIAGADCVKFQAYTADELSTRYAPKAAYQKECGEESQYEMLLKYELKEEDFKVIKDYCKGRAIDFLITPFSPRWVKIFYDMGVNMLKISSGSINSLALLKEIGMTGLPVILSTGMSTIKEIRDAILVLKESGCNDLSLLHCVSLYPTPIEKANLFVINLLKKEFNLPVGFSDHTKETITGQLAIASGATILEKHFMSDKNQYGPDHKASLSPHGLKEYVEGVRKAVKICGTGIKEISKEELQVKEAVQSSLVAKKFIKKGDKITAEMLTEKRPFIGISPMEINNIIGKTVIKDIILDKVLTYDCFKK